MRMDSMIFPILRVIYIIVLRIIAMEVKFSSDFHEIMKFHSDEILLP